MSVTTPADVRALVKTALTDPQLQAVIDREEAYLARELGAPIAGERTQEIWRLPGGISFNDIHLKRPTDEITTVVDNGVDVDLDEIRLLENGTIVERAAAAETSGAWTGPLITVKYTPNDEAEVVRVVIELCRLTLLESGFIGETIGTYAYEKGRVPASSMQVQNASRKALVRTLLQVPRNGSPRLGIGNLDRIGVPQSVTT